MSAQNEWYRQPGIDIPSVLIISGRYFLDLGTSSSVLTWANFINRTQTDVENQLDGFFADSPRVRANTHGTIIMDIENSADGHSSHPSDLHLESAPDQASLISAWKTRIAACRAVFPNAKIGLYGTLIGGSRGLLSGGQYDTFIARKAALIAAGTTGGGAAFDGLDYLVPIVYPNFGPDDSEGSWTSYYAMTIQAVTGSYEIKKSDGSTIPLLPLIGGYVSNGSSANNGDLLLDLQTVNSHPLDNTWVEQFRAFRDTGADEIVFWNGINSKYARDGAGATNRLVAEFVYAGKGWG